MHLLNFDESGCPDVPSPQFFVSAGFAVSERLNVAPFEASQETLAMLKILALGNRDVKAGKVKPVVDVVARLRAKRA